MRLPVLLTLLALLSANAWASSDEYDGALVAFTPSTPSVNSLLEPYEEEGSQVIIYDNPDLSRRAELQSNRKFIKRWLLEFAPPVAVATVGIALMFTTGDIQIPRYLTPNWNFSYHYNIFFFPTLLLEQPLKDQLDDFRACFHGDGNYISLPCTLALSNSLRTTLILAPVFFLLCKEMSQRCCMADKSTFEYFDGVPLRRVTVGRVIKGIAMAAVLGGGLYYLVWSKGLWDQVFTYEGPRALQPYSIKDAMDYCATHIFTGINRVWASYTCAFPEMLNMSYYLVPNPHGDPWTLCDHVRRTLPAGQYVLLSIPILALIFNWLYMIAWI